jgi:hypothetical protein
MKLGQYDISRQMNPCPYSGKPFPLLIAQPAKTLPAHLHLLENLYAVSVLHAGLLAMNIRQ